MSLPDWSELVKKDFPEMGPVTQKTLLAIAKHRHRCRGGMRIFTGRIWQDEEFEKRRRRVLSTPLP